MKLLIMLVKIHVVSGSGKGGGMTLSGENQEGERE